MRSTVLRENLYLLHELEDAASNVRYGLDEVPEATMVMADMFYTQVRNFVNEITKIVVSKYNCTNED